MPSTAASCYLMQRLMRANQRARAPIDEAFSIIHRANFYFPSPSFLPLFPHIFDKLSRALIAQFVAPPLVFLSFSPIHRWGKKGNFNKIWTKEERKREREFEFLNLEKIYTLNRIVRLNQINCWRKMKLFEGEKLPFLLKKKKSRCVIKKKREKSRGETKRAAFIP